MKGASMSKYWVAKHIEAIAGSKFVYGLASLATNLKDEQKIDSVLHKSIRTWIREPLLHLTPPEQRRSNRTIRNRLGLTRWSIRVRKARFNYGLKVLRLPSDDLTKRSLVNPDYTIYCPNIKRFPGGGRRST